MEPLRILLLGIDYAIAPKVFVINKYEIHQKNEQETIQGL
jgi:hypothetical protein